MIRQSIAGLALVAFFTNVTFGQVTFFDGKSDFDAAMLAKGKLSKGIEDFEEGEIPDGAKVTLGAPLEGNVPNVNPDFGWGFPNGLTQKNLIIQDNVTLGASPPAPNPSGNPIALYILGAGFAGSNSKKIGEDMEILKGQEASLDLIFSDDFHTGVGFELSQFSGFGTGDWTVTVYNLAGDVIGTVVVPSATEPNKNFVGVSSIEPIGRINIWDENIVPDAIDNIQLWVPGVVDGVPAVSTWGLAALGLLLLVGAKVYYSQRRAVA